MKDELVAVVDQALAKSKPIYADIIEPLETPECVGLAFGSDDNGILERESPVKPFLEGHDV